MKLKFFMLIFLSLFSRSCDFYSNSLWYFQENGAQGEINPLAQIFGMGWNGLIITNILLVSMIIALHYYSTFRYKAHKVFIKEPANYQEYGSSLYFNLPDKFMQVFVKMPIRSGVLFTHSGYILIRVLIVGSFLATFHNLSQFYDFSFYDSFREIVKRPLFVIYSLIIFTSLLLRLLILIKEFKKYKETKFQIHSNFVS